MYCFTATGGAQSTTTSSFNLLPTVGACYSLPLPALNLVAGSLPPPEYAAASHPVALVPAEHILVTGAKRSFDDVLSQSSLMSCGTDLSSAELEMANDAKKFKADRQFAFLKPSRVIHFRGIPGDATENEVLQIGQPFGVMTNLVLAKKKNQALLEMADVSGAQAMINYYAERPPQIRGHTVFVQFSNHDHLKTEASNQQQGNQNVVKTVHQLSNGDDQQHQFKTVLRVIIENLLYAVTIDILKQIFSRYGQVLKIITFTKNSTFQALIQYSSPSAAQNAKTSLNGQNIYQGCCTMRIDYSKLQSLNVRYNNSKSRDFTDMTLPSGDITPVTFSSATAAAATVTYNPGNVIAPSFTPTMIPGIGLAYCATAPGNAQSFGIVQGSLPFGSCIVPATAVPGIRLPWQLQANAVLLVTNLNEEKVSPDALFTLFGVYGDVIRVKVMFNKKDNALVQFQDGNQAQIALTYLDKVKLWGKSLKVTMSKHAIVQMPKEQQADAGLTKDYTNSPLHRFKKPNSKNYNNIYAPSATLHLSNIPPVTIQEQLVELFAQYGTVAAFKFFETDHKMALVQMSSIEEAVLALIELHNHQLAETSHLRVSFSKSTIAAPIQMAEYLEP